MFMLMIMLAVYDILVGFVILTNVGIYRAIFCYFTLKKMFNLNLQFFLPFYL